MLESIQIELMDDFCSKIDFYPLEDSKSFTFYY